MRVARAVANTAIAFLLLLLLANQIAQRVPVHMLYSEMPRSAATFESTRDVSIDVPHELLATDQIGRSIWSLVYYLDSESRVCAGESCSSVQDAGLVVFPLDGMKGAISKRERLTIVPVAVSSKDLTQAAAIEKLENGGYPAQMIESIWKEFEQRPRPRISADRGLFFAKTGSTGLHQAVSWFRDWMRVWGTDVGLGLILVVMVRLMLRGREVKHE